MWISPQTLLHTCLYNWCLRSSPPPSLLEESHGPEKTPITPDPQTKKPKNVTNKQSMQFEDWTNVVAHIIPPLQVHFLLPLWQSWSLSPSWRSKLISINSVINFIIAPQGEHLYPAVVSVHCGLGLYFITEVWSVDQRIIVMFINGCGIGD